MLNAFLPEPTNTIIVIKSRSLRKAYHAARIGYGKKASKFLIEIFIEKDTTENKLFFQIYPMKALLT